MLVEHVYRYPRRITLPLELLCGLFVGWSLIGVARGLLLLLWTRWPVDPLLINRVPPLGDLISWIARTGPREATLAGLLPSLFWLLLALFVALIVRNAFPAVRFSIRGMLVWFANDWVPVQWEGIQAIRVWESADAKRFAVLVQTDAQQLTAWHRLYGFLFRLSFQRGFYITSALHDGEGLLRHVMDEIERQRKLGEQFNITLEERARAPLIELLINPRSAFRRTNTAPDAPVFQPIPTHATMAMSAALTMPSMGGSSVATHRSTAHALPAAQPQPAPAVAALPGDAVVASYPPILRSSLNLISVLIVALALWRYIAAWTTFLLFEFPSLQRASLFQGVALKPLISAWGVLIGAHLGLLLVAAALLLLHHLFPTVTVDSDGLVLTALGRSRRLTWEQIQFVKATDVRDEQHVVLVEAVGNSLPWYYIVGSWLYDGGAGRGALIWPMARSFEPLMQRLALELTRRQDPEQPVRLRDDTPGWLLMLVARPADALDRLVVMHQRDEDMPSSLEQAPIRRAARQMLWNAALPVALLLTYWMMYQGLIFSLRVPVVLLLALLWGMTEWPLASFLASSLDQVVGAGNKGYQGLYMYPVAQLPRLLPLSLALLLTLMGFPNLALFVWASGISWSGLLTAGLWESLYGWRGFVLLAGSSLTVFFQILTLVGMLALRG